MTPAIDRAEPPPHARVAIPRAAGWPVLGVLYQLRRDPLGSLTAIARQGDAVVVPAIDRMLLVNRPEYVEHVLQRNQKNYRKGAWYARFKPLLGEGLITSEGDAWRHQRQLAQPAFAHERLADFAATMVGCTASMLDRWESCAATSVPLDVHRETVRLTLTILGRTVLDVDLAAACEPVRDAFAVALEITNHRVYALLPAPLPLPTPRNRRYRRALTALRETVQAIVRARRGLGGTGADVLTLWIHDGRPGSAGLTDSHLIEALATMLVVGHETTALVLTFLWYLLSLHPAANETMRAEIAAVLGDRPPTAADLPRLRYTEMILHETMRLFPPVWILGRQAIERDSIGPYDVAAGATIMVSPYLLHRHPAYWPNPEGFDPERFAPGREAERPRFAYVPFGAGARQCLGTHYALMEMLIITAMVAQRYRLDLTSGYRLVLDPSVTLRPRSAVTVTLTRRR